MRVLWRERWWLHHFVCGVGRGRGKRASLCAVSQPGKEKEEGMASKSLTRFLVVAWGLHEGFSIV